jgi:hypothetical protein
MAFFPASLYHSVNPFYTSDEYRISIAGNVYCSPVQFIDYEIPENSP